MTFDKHLALRARERIEDSSPTRQQYAENLIHDWETACKLSQGPIPERSAHWEKIAMHLRSQIAAMAGEQPRKLVKK